MANIFSRRCIMIYGLASAAVLSCFRLGVNVDSAQAAAATAGQTVKVVIDYADGTQKIFSNIPWKQDMTVQDAMNVAKSSGHGIQYQFTGSGETAFLTQIDDVKDQGTGADKRNWLYSVDGKLADKSFGVYKLNAGDDVLWKFDVYHESAKK